jgi:hypothetical protein
MRWVLCAMWLSACSADTAPIVDAAAIEHPARDAALGGECVLVGTGPCSAEWVCRSDGQRLLACDLPDAGTECTCAAAGITATTATRPTGCDLASLTAFAIAVCGWRDL